jgi:hypothetical protein
VFETVLGTASQGIAGGDKFCALGIFFKFARDTVRCSSHLAHN